MVLKLIEALLDIDNGSIGNLERQLIRLVPFKIAVVLK